MTQDEMIAANALDAEAARMEAPHAELRGWGVMRPDGTLMFSGLHFGYGAKERATQAADYHNRCYAGVGVFVVSAVRLTTEGA
jgi:hypothetical protein